MAKKNYEAVCRKHWSCFITHGFFAFIFLMMALGEIDNGDAPKVFLTIAVLIMIPAIIKYKTDFIAIDGNLIVGHVGFIRSKKLSAPLVKVQGVSIGNGLLGKIFRYHTVTVDTAGSGSVEYVFHQMGHAQDFVDAVNRRIAQ